jgi:hypothetical protein
MLLCASLVLQDWYYLKIHHLALAGLHVQCQQHTPYVTSRLFFAVQIALFESLGRLLADVRAYVRRGRTRDVSGMLGKLVETANRVSAAISTHMQREESEVLPLLAAALGSAEQRAIVWHTPS